MKMDGGVLDLRGDVTAETGPASPDIGGELQPPGDPNVDRVWEARATARKEGPSGAGVSRLLTVRELSESLGIHPQTIYLWAARGRLPCIRIGNRLRFDPHDITRWLASRKEG